MATDAKKHTTIAAGEKPSRAALASSFLSINDIIPVANATEANQVAAAVAAAGQNLATNPVFVSRANARGLHRVEYSYDGTVWLPASGVLSFASKSAADTWASSNSALLSVGDVAFANNVRHWWDGTAWRPRIVGRVTRSSLAETFTTAYKLESANDRWDASIADGINAYNNGWTIPITGRYLVSYEIRADGAFLSGISVNYSGGSPQLILGQTSTAVQTVAAVTVSKPHQFTAGDVIRLYLLANTGTLNWAASVGDLSVELLGSY